MIVQEVPPLMNIKTDLSKYVLPLHSEIVKQIIEFVNHFLVEGVAKNIQHVEESIKYLCLEEQSEKLIEELNKVFQNQSEERFNGNNKNKLTWREILTYHSEDSNKVSFLSQVFQQLQGRTTLKLLNKLFYASELKSIKSNTHAQDIVISTFLEIIYKYRQLGSQISPDHRLFIKMVLDIGLYSSFIDRFSSITNDYYQSKRQTLLRSQNWIILVQQQLIKQFKLSQILGRSLNTVAVVKKQLINQTLKQLLNLVAKLVEFKNIQELKLVWKYVCLVNKQDDLQKIIEHNILNSEESIEKRGVQSIVLDKLKLLEICQQCFENNRQIVIKVQTCYESIFSRQSTLANQIMAEIFIKKLKCTMLAEQDQNLIFEMFKTNPSKDLLIQDYKDLLAKQILMGCKDLSSHVTFINKIAGYSGNVFTKSLETIVNDVWKDGQLLYYQADKLHTKVLNKHQWPKIEAPSLVLPDQMTQMKELFLQKYEKTKPNQQLKWIHWLSQITLKIDRFQIVVSEIQAAMIFYIARAIRPMKKHQLATALQADLQLVISHLQPLKQINLIIQDRNQSLQINYQNILPYNYTYNYQPPRKTRNHIINDRALAVQAKIVRILKKKKSLPIPDVIKQVISSIKQFKPTIQQINNCMKTLVNKLFIEISEGEAKYKS